MHKSAAVTFGGNFPSSMSNRSPDLSLSCSRVLDWKEKNTTSTCIHLNKLLKRVAKRKEKCMSNSNALYTSSSSMSAASPHQLALRKCHSSPRYFTRYFNSICTANHLNLFTSESCGHDHGSTTFRYSDSLVQDDLYDLSSGADRAL